MRIQKIELIGFKSFKDRTVIHFDQGITGVVGPNGCGKSNIVDGLVWVMGEMSAKDLRGSSMVDVIFAGAEGHAPAGMAEVSLTLENDGGPFPAAYLKHSEIMVTRRLHRSGDSEYFINKEPARLKDIQEIFMDTGAGSKGFSIIQQGMIGKIITAKPEDRRMLIEEAAGITKFKNRKRESLRKIESTDQNLMRLQDIIGELKRQLDSLQRQANKAEKYREVKAEIEALDLQLSSAQYADIRDSLRTLERSLAEVTDQETAFASDVTAGVAALETLRVTVLEAEKKLYAEQGQVSELQSQAQRSELEIQSLRHEIEQNRSRGELTQSLIQEKTARLEILVEEDTRVSTALADGNSAEKAYSTSFHEKNSAFEGAQTEFVQIDDDLSRLRQEYFALGQTESSVEGRLNSLDSQHLELTNRFGEQKKVLAELRERKNEFEKVKNQKQTEYDRERQLQFDLSQDVASFETNKKTLADAVATKKTETEAFKDQLGEVTSLLYGLEKLQNSFEGFEEGAKDVLQWQKAKDQKFQAVADALEVPEEYEAALSAVLGSKLQTVLLKDATAATAALEFLKGRNTGRASFAMSDHSGRLLATELKTISIPNGEGVRGLLQDHLHITTDYRDSIQKILGHVVIAENVTSALRLSSTFPGWSFVTPAGDYVDQDGVLTGGSVGASAESGVLKRRREIKDLTVKKDEWAGKFALAQSALKRSQEQLEQIDREFTDAQQKKVNQELRVLEMRKDLERVTQEVANVNVAVTRQEKENTRLAIQEEELAKQIEGLRTSLIETRQKKSSYDSVIEEKTLKLESLRSQFQSLQAAATEARVNLARQTEMRTNLSREKDKLTDEILKIRSEISLMAAESDSNSEKITENGFIFEQRKIEFEKLIANLEHLKGTIGKLRNVYEEHAADLRLAETKNSMLQSKRNDFQFEASNLKLKFEQAKMRELYLVDQVREKYLQPLAEVYERFLNPDFDPQSIEQNLRGLREKLSRMGEVNLSSIEEFDETRKRYDFLTGQQSDLVEAKNQLKRVIDKINKICSVRFRETFDLVNERFQRVFPVLFGGGEAHLELIHDAEKDEFGIDIIAMPPGKKMQNISLLSGGEKALTAVSLIFSIFLVKPSPYCLLDEVDAPLDDANVFRFNDLVREMAKRSQIIVVTHNKHTMESASKLYGVTMQERGVSTMVSVNLADVRDSA